MFRLAIVGLFVPWSLGGFLHAGTAVQDPPKESLSLTVTTDKTSYALNEDIQAEVVLANKSEKDVDAAELLFEERSVSFDVTFDAGEGKKKQFVYSVTRPDPHLADRLPLPRFTLKAGKSVSAVFRIPTLKVGKVGFSALYKGAEKESRSTGVDVTVTEAGAASKLTAAMETSMGPIAIDLAPEEAPNNVSNFISLVKRGFYDNLTFFRVVKNDWFQTGCPYDLGVGGPGYSVKSEAKDQTAIFDAGTVAMSGSLKSDYAGSQFFIVLKRIPSLDKKYTIIGRIDEKSQENARSIGAINDVDRNTDKPKVDVILKKVTIQAR